MVRSLTSPAVAPLAAAEDAVATAEEHLQQLTVLVAALLRSWTNGVDGQDADGAIGFLAGMQQFVDFERVAHASVLAARNTVVTSSSEMRQLPGVGTDSSVTLSKLHTRVWGSSHGAAAAAAAPGACGGRSKAA